MEDTTDKNQVIAKFPSLCYSCTRARRTAAETLQEEGYTGCCLLAMSSQTSDDFQDLGFIKSASVVATGWVDLRSPVFGDKSGVITNHQIITQEVRLCTKYEKRYED